MVVATEKEIDECKKEWVEVGVAVRGAVAGMPVRMLLPASSPRAMGWAGGVRETG